VPNSHFEELLCAVAASIAHPALAGAIVIAAIKWSCCSKRCCNDSGGYFKVRGIHSNMPPVFFSHAQFFSARGLSSNTSLDKLFTNTAAADPAFYTGSFW
jgi:hypothetical protein